MCLVSGFRLGVFNNLKLKTKNSKPQTNKNELINKT